MENKSALATLAALGQFGRLAAFRRLVAAAPAPAPEGMMAGDLAADLDMRANTLSSHLALLRGAGLVHSRREGRGVRYLADLDGLGRLVDFLVHDCCGGQEVPCAALGTLRPDCCNAR